MTVRIEPIRPEGPVHRFRYGDEVIRYERLPRKTESTRILIKVHPNCRVQVRAPETASDEIVKSAVRKRAAWIASRMREFRESSAFSAARQYVSGESHFYLGKQHLLKVMGARKSDETVKLFRGRFEIHTTNRKPEHVRKLLTQWYRERAGEVFSHRLDAVSKQALWIADIPELTIRTMTKQWGSCSPSGRLTLNLHLIKAPRDCIDYVILHELCHLAEHNHSKRFYRLMRQVMPDWESTKNLLDSRASTLLVD